MTVPDAAGGPRRRLTGCTGGEWTRVVLDVMCEVALLCVLSLKKVNADTHAPQGGKADGGEPQTLLGRLQRVVLPVKRDRSPGNPNTAGDYSSCALEE